MGELTRTYQYRLYPTRRQVRALEEQLGFACDLYNAALEQRRRLWREHGRAISRGEQQRQLTALRGAGLGLEGMNAWCQQDVLRRVDRAFEAFFRRCRRGHTPGYPRFKSRRRFDTLCWDLNGNGGGAKLVDRRLSLQGVGHVRLRLHRDLPADAKLLTVQVTRRCGKWYANFALRMPTPKPLLASGSTVGIDLGINTFAAISTGELVEGPRAFRASEAELARRQQRVARRRRGSNRRRKAALQVAKAHERIRRQRRHHAHELARRLVAEHDMIVLEDLNLKGLARGALAKHVNDQAWGMLVKALRDKAEEAGRTIVFVGPRHTSQDCSACGHRPQAKLTLADRTYHCTDCGLVEDRDLNAARNILKRLEGSHRKTDAQRPSRREPHRTAHAPRVPTTA